jgi:hypothetical protein
MISDITSTQRLPIEFTQHQHETKEEIHCRQDLLCIAVAMLLTLFEMANLFHYLLLILLLLPCDFVEGGFLKKLLRETNRVVHQRAHDLPMKVIRETSRFLTNHEQTTSPPSLPLQNHDTQPNCHVPQTRLKRTWGGVRYHQEISDDHERDEDSVPESRKDSELVVEQPNPKRKRDANKAEREALKFLISTIRSEIGSQPNQHSRINHEPLSSQPAGITTPELHRGLDLPMTLKISESPRYREDYQDFMRNAPQNCLPQPKVTFSVYFLSVPCDPYSKVWRQSFPNLLSKIENSDDGYVIHQPDMRLGNDSLEIGYAIIKIVERDDDYLLVLIFAEITSPMTPNCQIDEDFHRKYLTASTGLSGVQWWLGIQALGSQEVKDAMEHPQHLKQLSQ